jgi:hypothetical protein
MSDTGTSILDGSAVGWVLFVATLVAAIAAVAGVHYARSASVTAEKALNAQEASDALNEARHLTSIQPRPRLTVSGDRGRADRLELSYANTGGAAVRWVALLQRGVNIFYISEHVPAHYTLPPGGVLETAAVGEVDSARALEAGLTRTLCSYACDVEGHWWDCISEARLEELTTEMIEKRLVDAGADAETAARLATAADR